jgi:nucleotide-binding universal stress UspA family protein
VKKNKPELHIRRILVALDVSTHSLAALDAAAVLAANLQAELVGLFVEDENLLHLAGLPFAQELRSPSAARHRMSSDKMEHDMRLQASQARRALEAAAEHAQARWSFRTVRGQVSASVLAAALDADLLAMGRVSRPFSHRDRLGSTARAATTGTKRSLLLASQAGILDYPVLVTYDGSEAAQQALSAASRLAKETGDELNVLLLSDSEEEVEKLRDEVVTLVEDRELSVMFHWMRQATVAGLASIVDAAENCVLVLGGDNPLLKAEAIQELLDKTDCPVMLVR